VVGEVEEEGIRSAGSTVGTEGRLSSDEVGAVGRGLSRTISPIDGEAREADDVDDEDEELLETELAGER
jgi:hypothetical protein